MSNEVKAALWGFGFTLVGGLVVVLTNLLAAVENFVNGSDPTLADDFSTAYKAVAVLVLATVTSIVNWAYRYAQTKVNLPGKTPVYTSSVERAGGDVDAVG